MLMLWELLFFLRKSLQFYQMLYIIHLLFTDGFPSGQRGQTVNLLAPPSKVRILLHPANLALTSLRCRSYFFCAKRKPQRGRKAAAPLHTPRAFFKEFLVVDEGRVLTCVCMLGYWMWDAVPIWFLYASVLDVERCADLFLYIVFFWHWAGCTFASILCSLRLNFQPGMWQRYGLLRRRCDTA